MSARDAKPAPGIAMDPLTVPMQGTQLVEASAGTGKTHAITTLFVRLLLEAGVPVDGILVVTYTNAATAELTDRIRRRLRTALAACGDPESLPDSEGDLRELLVRRRESAARDRLALEEALRHFDEAAISTVHAFCQRVLREHAFESGASFDARLLHDESRLRDEILRDFWVQSLSDADRDLVEAVTRDSRLGWPALAGLVRKALANPDLRLLPHPVPAPPTAADLRAWRSARGALLEVWRRTEIEALLANDPGLSHAEDTYREDQVAALLDDFEVAIAADGPAVSLRLERLEMLTPAGLAARTKKNRDAPVHPFFEACARLHETETPWRMQIVGLACRLVESAREEAATRKRRLDCLSFDDLLLRLRDGLRAGDALAGAIRQRHPVALVDEFQDTDPVQWEILDLVWGRTGAPLFLIGDPKQAIYAFRGADVFAYLRAKRQAEAVRNLAVNRRSDPGLLRALNAFFGIAPSPFEHEDIPYVDVAAAPGRRDVLREQGDARGVARERTAPLRVLLLSDEHRGKKVINVGTAETVIPPGIATEIVRLLESGLEIPRRDPSADPRLRPGDVAVLCRTNLQARSCQEALLARGVPAVLHGDRSVFESEEARDVATLLEAMADPTDPRLLRAAMATALYGATAVELAAFEDDDRLYDEATTRFFHWHGEWTAHGFLRAFRAFLEDLGLPARLLRGPRGERRLTNVLHVAELLHRAAVTGHRGPHELIDWLRREIEEGSTLGELAPEEVQIRLESDAAAVTLTTIHKAKGLEWPIVFCPYLWQESKLRFDDEKHLRFHDGEERLCLDVGSAEFESHRKRAEDECRAEGLRLLYVALTRARHQCSFVWGGVRAAEGSPLARFLAPDEESLGDEQALRDAMAPLLARAGDAIAIEVLAPAGDPPWRGDEAPPPRLAVRSFGRPALDESWRTSSFTALASATGAAVSREARDGADRDEIAAAEPPAEATATAPEADLPLADFPAGARAGILVHEILEHVDFARPDPAAFERTIETRLRLGGFEARWKDALRLSLGALLDATLDTPQGTLRLADVPAKARLPEMGFTLPVGPDDGQHTITPAALAAVFAEDASASVSRDYAERVRALGFRELAGYLRGAIDLVFEHEGRFWLVDWKSNHLGRRAADYRPAALGAAMSAHHYVLQYHLYTAALDRYLRLRKPGYEYARDFGGVLYLFVRGFLPGGDGRAGVFFDRPSPARIGRLTGLLERAEVRS